MRDPPRWPCQRIFENCDCRLEMEDPRLPLPTFPRHTAVGGEYRGRARLRSGCLRWWQLDEVGLNMTTIASNDISKIFKRFYRDLGVCAGREQPRIVTLRENTYNDNGLWSPAVTHCRDSSCYRIRLPSCLPSKNPRRNATGRNSSFRPSGAEVLGC